MNPLQRDCNLRSWSDYDYLADAALANQSRLARCELLTSLPLRYNNQFSLGRVQTPTLAMIEKDAEIEKFTPEDYREIHLSLRDLRKKKQLRFLKMSRSSLRLQSKALL